MTRRIPWIVAVVIACGRCAEPVDHSPRWWDPTPTPFAGTPPPTRIPPSPTPSPSPTPPACAVRLLEREPTAPFDWLGMVEVERRSQDEHERPILDSAREAACRLGGDAIVVFYRENRLKSGSPRPPGAPGVFSAPAFRGAVIRYRR